MVMRVLVAGCADGWYGPRCNSSCDCLHQSTCHHVTGKCTCSAGWEGVTCNKCKQTVKLQLNCADVRGSYPLCPIVLSCTHTKCIFFFFAVSASQRLLPTILSKYVGKTCRPFFASVLT